MIKIKGMCHKSPTSNTIRTLIIIAPALQGLLVAKVRGIYPSNRLLFGLTCWMMTYVTVPFIFCISLKTEVYSSRQILFLICS